jgi:hypothetical protein
VINPIITCITGHFRCGCSHGHLIWGSPGPSEKESKEKGCQIRATMNGDVIETFDYQGDEKVCQQYAERLRPYFDLKNTH